VTALMNFRPLLPSGFIPHSRLIRNVPVHQLQSKPEWWLRRMAQFPHVYCVHGGAAEVATAAMSLQQWIIDSNAVWEPWTCCTIDRRRSPRSMWGFSDDDSAVIAIMHLRDKARIEVMRLR